MPLAGISILQVVPTFHPHAPSETEEKEDTHTHIQSTLSALPKQLPLLPDVVYDAPLLAYASLPQVTSGFFTNDMHEAADQDHDLKRQEGDVQQADQEDEPWFPATISHIEPLRIHPSPIALAPFVVQQNLTSDDDPPTPQTAERLPSRDTDRLGACLSPPPPMARKESSTLGLIIDETTLDAVHEELHETVRTAKHGSPSRARMVKLSPTNSARSHLVKVEDIPEGDAEDSQKAGPKGPLIPQIKVHEDGSPPPDPSKSPFEIFSPLLQSHTHDLFVPHQGGGDDRTVSDCSQGDGSDKSRFGGPGMTPSLAEIMDRVGMTAQKNRVMD